MARRPRTPLDQIPDLCFIEDVAAALGRSKRTIQNLCSAGTFPIKELPRIDDQKSWSGERVREFIRDRDQPKPLRRVG